MKFSSQSEQDESAPSTLRVSSLDEPRGIPAAGSGSRRTGRTTGTVYCECLRRAFSRRLAESRGSRKGCMGTAFHLYGFSYGFCKKSSSSTSLGLDEGEGIMATGHANSEIRRSFNNRIGNEKMRIQNHDQGKNGLLRIRT